MRLLAAIQTVYYPSGEREYGQNPGGGGRDPGVGQ